MTDAIVNTIANKDLLKPQSYERYEFEAITLKNGVKLMLMSSPSVDKACCCFGVGVGSLNESEEYQGLAHFCEHMLFMGNDKYPDEKEYCQYIANGGGERNAYTNDGRTTYFASIKPEMLDGLVDRLTQFFLSPHFAADGVDREVEAVNSEFELYAPQDVMRTYMLKKRLANPKHPFYLFSVGNNKYLRRLDKYPDPKEALTKLRQALLDFHDKYYSSHLIFAFVSGNQPLAELREMTVPRLSLIKRKEIDIPRGRKRAEGIPLWKEIPKHQLILYVPTAEERRRVEFIFTIPDQHDYWRSKPSVVFSHVIGHEGQGSVLSYLKKKAIATSLRAGCDEKDLGSSLETVTVDFTEQAFSDENIVDCGKAIFAMTRLLVESGVPDWLIDEIVQLQRLQFQFEELPNTFTLASEMGRRIHDYGLENAFTGDTLITEIKRDAIMDVLNHITPDNVRLMLQGKKYESRCQSVEPIYTIKYHEDHIPAEWLKEWHHIMKRDAAEFKQYCNATGIHLMAPNQYIPKDLTIHEGGLPLEQVPTRLDVPATFYHKQDGHFKMPVLAAKCLWTLPATRPTRSEMDAYLQKGAKLGGMSTAAYDGFEWYRRVILTYFLVEMIEESLKEEMYDAELVDTKFVGRCKDTYAPYNVGLSLSVRGYNAKAHLLVRKYIDQYKNFVMKGSEFTVVYTMLQRHFATRTQTQDAYVTAGARVTQALGIAEWSEEELVQVLRDWKQQELQQILTEKPLPKWLHQGGSMRGMIYGNIDRATATNLYVKPFLELCATDQTSSPETCVAGMAKLHKGKDVLLKAAQSENDEFTLLNSGTVVASGPTCLVYQGPTVTKDSPDNACVFIVQAPCAGLQTEMVLLLADNWLSTNFFNDLRTSQALGYVVGMRVDLDNRTPQMKFVVQSTRPSLYVLSRIEVFLRDYLFGGQTDFNSGFKLKCTAEEFETMKSAVISELQAKPKSLAEQHARYCTAVIFETFDFERRIKGIEFIRGLNYDQFEAYLRTMFLGGVWMASCIDSTSVTHKEPEKSETLAASTSVSYYRMKDLRSIIRTLWNTSDYKEYFATYPVTA